MNRQGSKEKFRKKMRSQILRLILVSVILCACRGILDSHLIYGQEAEPIRNDGRLEFLTPTGKVVATIIIEIADTQKAQTKGLMGNRTLDDTMGMLFIYKQAGNLVFWMRNTRISLDILFVSETLRVINIAKNTQPMSDTRYDSKAPAQFVVEVLSGFCDRYGIKEGYRVKWVRK